MRNGCSILGPGVAMVALTERSGNTPADVQHRELAKTKREVITKVFDGAAEQAEIDRIEAGEREEDAALERTRKQ